MALPEVNIIIKYITCFTAQMPLDELAESNTKTEFAHLCKWDFVMLHSPYATHHDSLLALAAGKLRPLLIAKLQQWTAVWLSRKTIPERLSVYSQLNGPMICMAYVTSCLKFNLERGKD